MQLHVYTSYQILTSKIVYVFLLQVFLQRNLNQTQLNFIIINKVR